MKIRRVLGKIVLIILIVVGVILLIAFLFLWFYPSVGKTPNKEMRESFAQKSTLYYDGEFHNENDFTLMTGKTGETSDRVKPEETLPAVKDANIQRGDAGTLTVRWYGHSTTLIQLGDKNIFLDPVLSKRASPVGFAGPKRFSEIALPMVGKHRA